MDKAWRNFELLVARIERWLAPRGAIVTSPDKVADKETGRLREVDATIRFQVGSSPILVAIECRDRQSVEDVQWIEQLATKRQSIGAATMVAVSSRGFTKPAIDKAKKLDVLLRSIEDISEDDCAQWARNIKIQLTYFHWSFVSVRLEVAGGDDVGGVAMCPDVARAFGKGRYDTRIGIEKATGKPLTLRTIVDYAEANDGGLSDNLAPGAPPERRTLTVGFPRGTFSLLTDRGEMALRKMELTVDVALSEKQAPAPHVVQYRTPDDMLIQVAETKVPQGQSGEITLMYSQRPPTDFGEMGGVHPDKDRGSST
ncbi:MAG: hypothetical protein IID39_02870 [Planctomycetes bacterium]|nr:hypothetical protein [Planctomycetota bacterium]